MKYSCLQAKLKAASVVCLISLVANAAPPLEPLRLQFFSQLQSDSPCIASLIGPPTTSCIPWQPNVQAIATFDASRRYIFAGAADDLLHILDADTGRKVMEIKTEGRVITETTFSNDRSIFYVGTDKGVVHSFDAYSFASLFTFTADGKISNNLTLVDSSLVFTSVTNAVYSLNARTGVLNWRAIMPLAKERLRLKENSTIFVYEEIHEPKGTTLIVPHSDGFLTQFAASTGDIKQKILLGTPRTKGFPDIVAPFVFLNNRLWVASYDLGVFSVDLVSKRARRQIPIAEIVQLATDGIHLFAATPDVLYGLTVQGNILWKNNISEIKTRATRAGWPFEGFSRGTQRVFFGSGSRLLLDEDRLIMSTSLGSIGVFDKVKGERLQIIGNSVGFGPLSWASSSSLMAVTKRGLLMKFQIGRPLFGRRFFWR